MDLNRCIESFFLGVALVEQGPLLDGDVPSKAKHTA